MSTNATTSQPVTAARFQPGELVDVTIKNARVADVASPDHPVIRLGDDLIMLDLALEGLTVTRTAPAEWPPQPGDVWEDRRGILWFAIEFKTGFAMQSGSGVVAPIGRLLNEASPLTLAYRREDAR